MLHLTICWYLQLIHKHTSYAKASLRLEKSLLNTARNTGLSSELVAPPGTPSPARTPAELPVAREFDGDVVFAVDGSEIVP